MAKRFILAFYEIDRRFGGQEEGGWYYDCGELVRLSRIFTTEESAYRAANRANRLLAHIQRGKRGVGSVLYRGGRHAAEVYENIAPQRYPESRPHYE